MKKPGVEFEHDPGLFAFLQFQCSLKDDPGYDFEVQSCEQEFLEAVCCDESEKIIVRKNSRRSGGTTLFCAMALYYHLIGYRVALTTLNYNMLALLAGVIDNIDVYGYTPMHSKVDASVYLRSVLYENQRAPINIQMIVVGDRYDTAFKGKSFDYVFMDNVTSRDQNKAYQGAITNTTKKIVINVTA